MLCDCFELGLMLLPKVYSQPGGGSSISRNTGNMLIGTRDKRGKTKFPFCCCKALSLVIFMCDVVEGKVKDKKSDEQE